MANLADKIGYYLNIEIGRQAAANYLLGGFIKYYSDERHPTWQGMDQEQRAKPVKYVKIRLDLLTYMVEVSINDVRQRQG